MAGSRRSERSILTSIKRRIKARRVKMIRLAFRPGVTAGWSDLLILIPGGRPLFMETKRQNEKARELQEYRRQELLKAGYDAVVVDSVEDGMAHFERAMWRRIPL